MGNGGGGGGSGFIVISNPTINQIYNTSVASGRAGGNAGLPSTFYDPSNNGIKANGGESGIYTNTPPYGGTCVTVGTLQNAGALTARSGGDGAPGSYPLTTKNGSNSSGPIISVLGIRYNYGGGGASGGDGLVGGNPGNNGLGGIGGTSGSGWGWNATTPGSGGGGASNGGGGQGARGEIVVTFVYP